MSAGGTLAALPEFAPNKATFGRAQTFPLRLGWLPKACGLARENGDFAADELIAEWGVGKNMVNSIRHWAALAGVVAFDGTKAALTPLGEFVFGAKGVDPYLEDDATLWLLHWQMASRPDLFTAGFWFFNRFFKPSFTEQEAAKEMAEKMKAAGVKGGEDAGKRDIGVVLRMYCRRGKNHNEESLETPFPGLGLITYDDAVKEYRADPDRRETLPPGVVGYAAAQLLQAEEGPIAVRADSANPERAVLEYAFRLDGDSLLEKLDSFCAKMPIFQLQQVGGVWQLSGNSIPPAKQLLELAYAN